MFDFFTPANWFWILVALLISCYIKLQSSHQRPTPPPAFSPASIISVFRGGV